MEGAENKLRKNVRDPKVSEVVRDGNRSVSERSKEKVTISSYNDFGDSDPSPEASKALVNGQTNVDKSLFNPIIKTNQYQVRKSAARALMDAALMMANISQLRTVIELGHEKMHHFYLVVSLTILSLVMQIVFAILMFFLLMKESEMAKRKDYLEHLQMLESNGLPKEITDKLKKTITNQQDNFQHEMYMTRLNYGTIFLVFVITVINMFITGFGIRNKGEQ